MIGVILVFADIAWWIPAAWFGFLVVMAIDACVFLSVLGVVRLGCASVRLTPELCQPAR